MGLKRKELQPRFRSFKKCLAMKRLRFIMQLISHSGPGAPIVSMGKCVASRHVKQNSKATEVATISMDYFYFIKAESYEERGPPSIAIVDDKTRKLKSAVLNQKGVDEWSVKVVKNYIEMLGYKKIILRTDNENAIMALRNEVKHRSHVEIIPEQPPAYDSKTAGKAENAVQRVEKQFVT